MLSGEFVCLEFEMRSILRLFILIFAWECVADPNETLLKPRIVDFGIYLTNVDGTASAPDTTTGEISLLSDPGLIRRTTTIPALPKSSFGLRYELIGLAAGEAMTVTDVVITPGIKKPDSDNPVAYRESREDIVIGGNVIYTGYTFDEAWEAVPGAWIIEIWHKETKLLSKEFTVVPTKYLRN